MIDFIEYVVSELKGKRLSKLDARDLIRQFSANDSPMQGSPVLHPLLHRNVSDIEGQCYASSFDGSEFFLSDHQVMREGGVAVSVLPGMACLEMVRAAVADAWPGRGDADRIRIDDVVWIRPIVVTRRKELSIALSADDVDARTLLFEIFSEEASADGAACDVVHCRGSARLVACGAGERLDLGSLQARASRGELDAADVYPAYRRMGMKFGPAHQAVTRVFRGDGEVLAHLRLPEVVRDTWSGYDLHPSMLDGALQASIGLLRELDRLPAEPSVPFALQSLRTFAACRQDMVAWIRHAPGHAPNDKLSTLDIDLCDTDGNLCVRLGGLSSRRMNVVAGDANGPAADDSGLLLANPVWKPGERPTRGTLCAARHHVLWCGAGATAAPTRSLMPEVVFRDVLSRSAGMTDRFVETASSCFAAMREIIEDKSGPPAFVHVVASADLASQPIALSGLLKSAALEDPRLSGQLLLVEAGSTPEQVAACIRAEFGQAQDAIVRYRDGVREVLAWHELHEGATEPAVCFKDDGVYLVTGGLGGLGTLFAKEILRQTARAKVILTGRAGASDSIEHKLNALDASDAGARRVAYRAVDLTDLADVRRVVEEIDAVHGGLDGIVHAAGMIADRLIANKSAEEFARVLAPKVSGTAHLDLATLHEDLDFLVLFSSGASVMGNAGQSDYAVANGFLDQFAHLRNHWVESGQRKGRTLAINWPLWQDGGMRMPAHAQEAMAQATGMLPMQTTTGLRAFYRCLQAPQAQTLVIEGRLPALRHVVFGEGPAAPERKPAPAASLSTAATPAAAADAGAAAHDLAEHTRDFLRKQFAQLFKLPCDRLDPQAPLEKYGIDSILAMDLTRQLEKSFGPLSKTLFFEHQTIDELTGYLLRSHGAALASMFDLQPAGRVGAAATVSAAPALPQPHSPIPARWPAFQGRSRRARSRTLEPARAAAAREPIAIVGLSGRYPESDDIHAFWNNLRDGRNCITEIPRDRWDWRDYYTEDRSATGGHHSKWGGFIRGVDEFDPLFFGIPPVDAELIDPQERLFLQHAWMAIEDAGYTRKTLQAAPDEAQAGQVGVYVGVMYGEYQLFGAEASLQGPRFGVPGSYASIANRVSYVLDVHGPSMTVDTMCSSSLAAIHLACQDLELGRTHLAIAGGVNVTIHPNKYLILSAGQYISREGHCQSFGEGGDGYIPGEGVGAVVLKRLSDALRDGNHIYGVILASALNHGGKTNGYSVPNPKAQAAAIARALKESGVDARHVSYVEAHGTGTRLGDPIEIAALTQVFRQVTPERQFCAIGSAKSNIGHGEGAAGIAGLTKVLLQMKHRLIVPSLHASVLNPHIDFESSPFFVNQTLRPWQQPVVDGEPVARIAGISSFGAGGSNAHLIVQEHVDASASRAEVHAPGATVIVALSARTADQLRQKVRDLLACIGTHEDPIDLASLAFTLQVGREAMDARLAMLVSSVSQLVEKLEAVDRGDADVDRCHQGQVDPDAPALRLLGQDEDMMEAVDKWIARGKLSRLAELWVKGLALDWRKLWGERRPRLMSLPTYPFARDRYWVADRVAHHTTAAAQVAIGTALHPLLHDNTSDFFQQSYSTLFTGDEFFLADHQVETGDGRRRILPAVALLEMARAAVDHAVPAEPGSRTLEVRNVVWARPVVVDGRTQVAMLLSFVGDDRVDVEWRSDGDGTAGPVVHGEAQVVLAGVAARPALEIAELQSRMTGARSAPAGLYAAFQRMGIHYGPSFQCLADLRRGPDDVLAELVLPQALQSSRDAYALHPSLLDGALQSCIGLAGDGNDRPDRPPVPFALDTLTIVGPFTTRMFAWARHAAGAPVQEGVRKIDVDLCDERGRLCARLGGLALRPLASSTQVDRNGTLLAVPAWEPVPMDDRVEPAGGWQRQLVLSALEEGETQALAGHLPGVQVQPLPAAGDDGIDERYRAAALACFEHLKAILRSAPQEPVQVQLVTKGGGSDGLVAGLSGLIQTARLENPQLVGQLVIVDGDMDARTIARHLQALQQRPADTLVRIEHDRTSTLRWQVQAAAQTQGAPTCAYRPDGVYLITGGLGGLGLLFARDILQRAPGAAVVLTGRAQPSPDRLRAMEDLRAELSVPADRLVYRPLDLQRLEAIKALIAEVVARFGGLHGVIHSAGMTRDGWMIRKTSEEFADVLAPKVAGTVHLDVATQEVDLDFIALFSSVAAAAGNAGQADYAAANGFMDRFAVYRNALVAEGHRRGHTLAIDWPLWAEGGMRLDAPAAARLAQASGMTPLPTAAGLQAFHRSLEIRAGQVLVMAGDVSRLTDALRHRHAVVARPAAASVSVSVSAPAASTTDTPSLQEAVQRDLKNQFAELLKMPAHEVDVKAPLERYGMDSVLAMKLTDQLERSFGSLSKTLFFEYQTIAALAGYLVKAFPDIVRQRNGADASPAFSSQSAPQPPAPAASRLPVPMHGKLRRVEPASRVDDPIAIIGIAGRYPQARNLGEFWHNLKSGRDCITEIPSERWDHAPFFDPVRNRPGKTYSKWGGFLSDVDHFDALFFGISPREAELIDPQERLFLETVWETIEDAGYSKDEIARRRVGVYVGAMWGQYELYGATSAGRGVPSSSFASIANRVSYFFNFNGPSLALDTMCSSSLTAIHLACEAVRQGEIDVAVAGGVNVSIHPQKYLNLSQGNFASTDGRCRSFGVDGDGYVPGEGVGAVLLKPLRQALLDGDRIHAVIKASAINHGGKTNGYTVPNPVAQGELIAQAWHKARIDPSTIGCIETHGTGTSLGDPIEINGLVRAFGSAETQGAARAKASCAIGSVKSNIGHLESAAGIASVTKALLQLKHRQLVPSLHAQRLNPHIDLADTPFHVQQALEDWTAPPGTARRVAVSSFGAGGSNAHLVLEEFVDTTAAAQPTDRPELFLLSAKSRDRLCEYVGKTLEFLEDAHEISLADVAFTSQVGRTPMRARLAVVAASAAGLKDKLRQWLAHRSSSRSPQASADVEIEDVIEGHARAASDAVALLDGDAGRTFVQTLVEQRDLARLARLWVSGMEVDWASLHRKRRAKRVSLPTYPFARERHWIDAPVAMPTAPAMAAPVASGRAAGAREPAHAEAKQLLYCRTAWRESSLEPAKAHDLPAAGGTLLCLGADDDWLAEIERQARGATVVAVTASDRYRRLGSNRYGVDHRSEGDLATLVEDLTATGAMPSAIIHVAGGAYELKDALDRGVFALHGLCKAVTKHRHTEGVRIVSLLTGASGEQAALHRALAGYLKSLALEDPKFAWKVVSVQGDATATEGARLVAQELRDESWRDGEVRYDAGLSRRQVNVVERCAPGALGHVGAAIRHHGVYLVTGGLGGLGALFCEHLAKEYGARLVLTGRSELDDASRRKLASLSPSGSGDESIVYVRADVSDQQQAASVVAEARRRFGGLHGVIHCAGVHRDAFALNKTRDDMASVLAAKVNGAINLDRLTQDQDLDLFVMFSSVAGSFGNAGQCDYAFANSFLDAFAEQRQAWVSLRQRSGKSLSIGWPLWQDGGMRISRGDVELLERRTGLCPLPTQQGLRFWETLLLSDACHGIALYGDPAKIDATLLSRSVSKKAPAVARTPTAEAAPSLQDATEDYLKTLLSEEIRLPADRIDSQDRFEAYGVDSMMISRINAALERDLGELPKTLLYEYATVEELAGYLVRQVQPALMRHAAATAPAVSSASRPEVDLIDSPAPGHGADAQTPVAVADTKAPVDVSDVQAVPADPVRPQAANGDGDKIAIIGMHGHFPGSPSLAEYWRNLSEGRDLVGLVPPSRWDHEAFFDADPANAAKGKIYCKWGGFLEDVDKFDAAFFGIGQDDARMIDPQERLFIQSVWSAVEDAGYTRDSLKKRHPKGRSADVGVFVGVTTNSYHLLAPEEWSRGNMVSPGSLPWSIANRVSYFFDFQGPSMPIDTACSSSLVAIHLACESLKSKQCQVALAGGVNLYLHPSKYQSLCRRRMLALDGKCRSYGVGDDGFIPGEGVGTLVLKPLARAIEDGDHIYGVVAASLCEHSGRSNGYSAPNPNSQAMLIDQVLSQAGSGAESIGYVEGHGTGTQLGDSLEIVALTQAFRKHTEKTRYCALGSVKANVGHAESAAGIAGVAKILLQFEHRQIAPTIHSERVNPNIDFERSPFELQHELSPWVAPAGQPRRAMINSFGAGGVNSCLILEAYEAPETPRASELAVTNDGAGADDKELHLIVLSARNEARLKETAARLSDHLKKMGGTGGSLHLRSLSYTLQVGREAMEERLALVVAGADELSQELSAYAEGVASPHRLAGRVEPHQRKKSRNGLDGEQSKSLFERGDLQALARLWVDGQDVDWDSLYRANRPRRLPLPTYPFAKERYWVSDAVASNKPRVARAAPVRLHPLVDGNASTLREVCFSSSLTARDFYGRDHRVHGESFFCGAGFLEIACVGGTTAGEASVTRIEDVVWVQPLRLTDVDQAVKTYLTPNGSGASFSIVSFNDDNERVVHSEGHVYYGPRARSISGESVAIQALRERATKTVQHADCYRQFKAFGFDYGPCFRTIQELHVGRGFALSRLSLADELKDGFDQYLLHPCLVDGALQTVVGLALGASFDTPYLPFALGSVEILKPLAQNCYAYVEQADPQLRHADVLRFNIRLLSESGEVLVKLTDFHVRALHAAPGGVRAARIGSLTESS